MADTPTIPNEAETRDRFGVTPAKAGAYTLQHLQEVAGSVHSNPTFVRIGPGLRRGDGGTERHSVPLWVGRSRRTGRHGRHVEVSRRQIVPHRVLFFDALDLPVAFPFFHRLFAGNGEGKTVMNLNINQPLGSGCLGKAGNKAVAMFNQAAGHIVGDADVEGAVSTARKDVNVTSQRHLPSPRRRPESIRTSDRELVMAFPYIFQHRSVWAPAFAGVTE
jgi:hypothetical protein